MKEYIESYKLTEDNKEKLNEMIKVVKEEYDIEEGIHWLELLNNYKFLRFLFVDHVRLIMSGSNVGVPYYHFILDILNHYGISAALINFVYKEWKIPSITEENTEVQI